MADSSRKQEFTYQYKSISLVGGAACGYGPSIQVSLPDDLIAIKSLWFEVSLRYNSGEAQKAINNIAWNGITNGAAFYSNYFRVPVNYIADPTSNIVSFAFDATGLIPQTYIYPPNGTNPSQYIIFGLENPAGLMTTLGQLILWKVDIVYTTQGIR